jgi:hypothetical protein
MIPKIYSSFYIWCDQQVVLTVFKFPTIEDFVNSTKISPGQDSLVFVSQYDYDIFCYVGILASNETVLPPVNISFEMSFTVTNCIRWSASEMQWKVACKVRRVLHHSHLDISSSSSQDWKTAKP